MTRFVCPDTRSRISSIAMGLGFAFLIQAYAARASEPDIPTLQAEAARGSVQQEIALGAAYFVGRGVPRDEKLAAFWYEKAANAGDPEAQKQIGFFYQAGIGVPRDPARAVAWYERSAAGGLASAKANLGVAYVWGNGVPRDAAFGMQLFHEAVAKGDGLGAFFLGEMYYFGIGAEKDTAAARHWYETGAKLHEPRAEFRLGSLDSMGQKTPRELKRAIELFRASELAGYVPAKHALGLLLVNHPELAGSPQEGVALLEEAADEGAWQSSAVLGILARDGCGKPADSQAAYYHFRVAALQGGAPAASHLANELRTLSAKLGRERTDALDTEAAAWFRKHGVPLDFLFKNGDMLTQFPAFALASPEDDSHAERLIPAPPG
jgi:hypothetical protein